MNAVTHSSIRHRLLLAFLALFLLPMTVLAARPEVQVSISPASVTFAADASLYVRIGGPDGYFSELRGERYLQWTPEYGLTDGVYRYDCYASVSLGHDVAISEAEREAAAKGSSSRAHGVFLIENGALVEKDTDTAGIVLQAPLASVGNNGPIGNEGYGSRFVGAIGWLLNAIVSPAHALQTVDDDLRVQGYLRVKLEAPSFKQLEYDPSDGDLFVDGGDLILESGSPSVYFQDQSTGDDNWHLKANDSSFTIVDTVGTNNNFPLQIDTQAGTNVHNSIFVNALGDVSFANQSVYIDRSSGSMGIGTSTPDGSLHIIDGSWPELVLQDTGVGARIWELEATDDEIRIRGTHPTSGAASNPFTVYNDAENDALVIGKPTSSSRNVGIGTFDPETGLHIWRGDGNGIIKVEENMAVDARRYQVQLENNGATGFLFTDTSNGVSWRNATNQGGDFVFAQGSNGPKLLLKKAGRVTIGMGNTANFVLEPGGDLEIPNGKVTATAFQQSSSRSLKQGFKPIDEAEVLDKLLALQITEWEYKDPGVSGRHLGPVAEEFHALFGFGASDAHIYPSDMASVSLVAARQIHEKALRLQREAESRDAKIAALEMQNAEIEGLRAQNADLKERLTRLEQLVGNMSAN